MARLILSLDGQVLAEYNMTKERYTIGRLPDNDVRIDNFEVYTIPEPSAFALLGASGILFVASRRRSRHARPASALG